MVDRARPDPADLSLREAAQRYLRQRRVDATDQSVDTWEYRLKLFVEWGEANRIESVGQLEPYDLVEYYELRSAEIAPATLEGEMWTLKMFMEFLDDLGAGDGLADAVRIPDVDQEDRSSDEKLEPDRGLELLRHYRSDPSDRGTRAHALIELLWMTGARQGGLRALDIRDVTLGDKPFVEFRHRPKTGTPLKNKLAGERAVAIPQESGEAIRRYIEHRRRDVHDDHGRQPLLASMKGRPTPNSVRNWTYQATQPCIRVDCPHGKERETCEWTVQARSSKCPSSKSPHPVRTGSITWMLNMGWPIKDIAERVNADPKTIRQHYDKADLDERRRRQREAMQDRRHLVDTLDISEHEPE